MGSRSTTKIPEFIYFVGTGINGWIDGPYVRPQRGRKNRKFRIEEVIDPPIEKIKNGTK